MRRRFTKPVPVPPPLGRALAPRRTLRSRDEIIEVSSASSTSGVENVPSRDTTPDRNATENEPLPPSYESVIMEKSQHPLDRKKLTRPNIRRMRSYTHLMHPQMPDLNLNEPWVIDMMTPVNDAFIFAKNIPPLEIPEKIFRGDDFPIFITQVHNPFKFWFNLHLEETAGEIHELFSDMHLFYCDEAEPAYGIHSAAVTAGRACAALYANVWHRGEILSQPDEQDCCKVFFVDFGTISSVHVSELRYLKNCYGKVPRQALRGRLALVAPPKTDLCWKFVLHSDATVTLAHLVSDRMLHALLYAYEDTEQIFHLFVLDLNYPSPLNINEELSVKGVAEYIKPKHDTFPHFDEIVPTFEMLEKGIYPPYSTLVLGNQMTIFNEFCDSHPEATKIQKNRRIIPPTLVGDTIKPKEPAPPPYSETWEKPENMPKSPPAITNDISKPSTSSSSVSSISSVQCQTGTNPLKSPTKMVNIMEETSKPAQTPARNEFVKRVNVPEPRPLKIDTQMALALPVVEKSVQKVHPSPKKRRLLNMLKAMQMSDESDDEMERSMAEEIPSVEKTLEQTTQNAPAQIQAVEQMFNMTKQSVQEQIQKLETQNDEKTSTFVPSQTEERATPQQIKPSKRRMYQRLLDLLAENE